MGANAHCLAIQPLDDCFYARKGVEMARSGDVFTVTWHGEPTFQNPPLEIWLQSVAVRVLGENDLAARAPSAVFGLLTCVVVYRIALLTFSAEAGLAAVALLLICPYFEGNARRCMMEMALCFWVSLGVLVFLEGQRRPSHLGWIAVPFAAALLTKSVLGLLLPIVLGGAAFDEEGRATLRDRRLHLGLLGGLALGLSWPLVEWARFGSEALRAHFLGEILRRSTAGFDLRAMAYDYPYYLAAYFEPALPLGLLGVLYLLARKKAKPLLAFWAVAPIVLYSLSSARSARYVFPIFPPLALCGGALLASAFPGAGLAVRRGLAPLGLLGATVLLWVRPTLLVGQGTAIFKNDNVIRARLPVGQNLPYYGKRYWLYANPLLYYTERYLLPPADDPRDAIIEAAWSTSKLLLVDRERLIEIPWSGVRYKVLEESDDWVLMKLNRKDPDDL
jgi:4-amino-4-deoxy-L-arabinose transferase-like glycosyltransferase